MFSGQLIALLAAGDAAAENSQWAEFAAFCHLRAKGLRKPALRKVEVFVAQALCWSFTDRTRFIAWLMPQLGTFGGSNSPLLPHPLLAQFVLPTLLEWKLVEPERVELWVWHGSLVSGDESVVCFKGALEIDPDCQQARRALASFAINDVEYNQHHLPDYYVGDPEADLQSLAYALRLINQGSKLEYGDTMRMEITELVENALAHAQSSPSIN